MRCLLYILVTFSHPLTTKELNFSYLSLVGLFHILGNKDSFGYVVLGPERGPFRPESS
jgi:hypothetical protein